MCVFCAVRGKTIREMRQQVWQLEREIYEHEKQIRKCFCKTKVLKHPERKWQFQQYYQANREAILAKAKVRNERKRAGAVTGPVG